MWAGNDEPMDNGPRITPNSSPAGEMVTNIHSLDSFNNDDSMESNNMLCASPEESSIISTSRNGEHGSALQDYDDEYFRDSEMVDQSEELRSWIQLFSKFTRGNQRAALTMLIDSVSMPHVRHFRSLIEPHFQRDFLSCLPYELSLKILQGLDAEDVIKAACVSQNWRLICEVEHVWKARCDAVAVQLGPPTNRVEGAWIGTALTNGVRVHAHMPRTEWFKFRDFKITHKYGSIYHRSPYKSLYMRKSRILSNWIEQPLQGSCVLRGHDDHVITCMQIHGDILVTGSDDNNLKVWSIDKGQCKFTLSGHTGGVWTSQISTDGKYIVSGSTDRTVRVWSAENGNLVHTLSGHTSTVRCMSIHGYILVTGSRDTTLRVWDIERGECLRALTGHHAAVRCVQFDGVNVVSGGYDFTVKVWNAMTGACVKTLSGHGNRVYSLLFDPVRRIVVSGSLDTSIRVWDIDLKDGEECIATLLGHTSLTSGMALRGHILVSCNADSHVRVWDIRDGSCIFHLAGPNGHRSAITSLQFFDDHIVATSSDDGTVKLWDVKKGIYIRDLVSLNSGGNGGCIWRLCSTPNLLACAVGSRNNTEETKVILLDFDSVFP